MEWDTKKKPGKPYQEFSDKIVSKALIRGEKITWKCIDKNRIQCHQILVRHFGKSLKHRPLRFIRAVMLTAKWETSVTLLPSDKFVS